MMADAKILDRVLSKLRFWLNIGSGTLDAGPPPTYHVARLRNTFGNGIARSRTDA